MSPTWSGRHGLLKFESTWQATDDGLRLTTVIRLEGPDALLEAPRISDLDGLPVEVVAADEPGVVSVTTWANDGSVVTLTWDEMAGSVHLRWTDADEERLVVERESASRVSVRENHGQIEFWVWSDAGGLGGQLVVRVAEHVCVSDALLRR